MKKMVKVILAAAAVVALAVPAMATDKLIVKSATATPYDIIKLGDDGTIETKDAAGLTQFYVSPLGRMSVGSNAPNAAVWLKGSVANNIQIVSFFSGVDSTTGGGGIVLAHSGAANSYARANDRLGYLLFASGALNGTTLRNGGGIEAKAEIAFTDTSAPTFFAFATAPTTGGLTRTERFRISADGNVVAGNKGGSATVDMVTTDTNGFLYIPNVAGALSTCGSAKTYPGHTAIWFDSTNKKICSCDAGTLKCTAIMN